MRSPGKIQRTKKERKLEIAPYRTLWFNEGNRRTKTLRKLPENGVTKGCFRKERPVIHIR